MTTCAGHDRDGCPPRGGARPLALTGARLAAPAILVALATVASLWPAAFVLDRDVLSTGAVWRLYTGHFVHATLAHFLFDVGVGAVLLLFVPWRRVAFFLPPFVGLAVLLARPDLSQYGGLSGALHGLTVLAAVHLARQGDVVQRVGAGLLLVGVVAKAISEAVFGASFFTGGFDMGGPTVYVAHLAGVLGGLLLALLDRRADRPAAAHPAGGYRRRDPARRLTPWARGVGSSSVR